MVYDRTVSDVNFAIRLRERGTPFTDSEIEVLERGMLTINTLNRIENKQNELKCIFNEIGYFNTSFINKTWSYDGIFTKNDLNRVCNNNSILRNAFFTYSNSPRNATAEYHYQEINYLEKILFDLENMVEAVKQGMLECDTFYCGEN